MSQDYCRGCGTVLQSTDPDGSGYIPESVLGSGKQLICQRCYRLNHYGEVGKTQPGTVQIRKQISKAIGLSAVVILVADLTDLTGTVAVWRDHLAGRPYILVVNKIDLLPVRTVVTEVVAYLANYLSSLGMTPPLAIIPVSSLKNTGMDTLTSCMATKADRDTKIAIIGATNVGKSSLVKRIIAMDGSKVNPTISKFPGTTLGLSNWGVLQGRNTLIDTPGLNPGDRLSDLLCPQCGSELTAVRLESKLWGVKPGKGLIIGGLLGLENQSQVEAVILAFAGFGQSLHRTDRSRLRELLTAQPEWLSKLCRGCAVKLKWTEIGIKLEPDQDLAVAGLGWISLRGAAIDLQMTIPEGIRWEIRPALFGKKKQSL